MGLSEPDRRRRHHGRMPRDPASPDLAAGEEVDWSDTDQNAAEAIGHSLVQKYITHIAPTQNL